MSIRSYADSYPLAKATFTAHDTYVKGFEYIGSASSWAWSNLRKATSYITSPLKKLVSFPIKTVFSVIRKPINATTHVGNRFFGQRATAPSYLQTFSPEYDSLSLDKKKHCLALSEACSKFLNSPVLIANIKKKENLIRFRGYLLQLKEVENAGLSIEEIDRALGETDVLLDILDKEELMGSKEITNEDIKNFLRSVNENLIINFSIASTLENIGENLGGSVLDKISYLPNAINPTLLLSSVGSMLGSSIGRIIGCTGTVASSLFLINRLFPKNNRAKKLACQAGVIGLIALLEAYNINPISNACGNLSTYVIQSLSLYSFNLLFSYIGMLAFNTEESLPEYVEKMTPAMVVYEGAFTLLEASGLNFYPNLLLSFYLSHMAYNSDAYKTMFKGELLEDALSPENLHALTEYGETSLLQTTTENISKNAINSFLTLIIGQSLSSLSLTNIDPETLFKQLQSIDAFKGVSEQFPFIQYLQEVQSNWLKINRPDQHYETSFVTRQFNNFFEIINSPEISDLIAQYKLALVEEIERSDLDSSETYEDLSHPASHQITEISNRLMQEIVRQTNANETLNPLVLEQLISLINENISASLFVSPLHEISSEIRKYVLIPKDDEKSSLCSALITEQLAKGFIFSTVMDLSSLNKESLQERIKPLNQAEINLFYKNLVGYFLKTVHYKKSLLRTAFNSLAGSQI
jgi:hypothetical protein